MKNLLLPNSETYTKLLKAVGLEGKVIVSFQLTLNSTQATIAYVEYSDEAPRTSFEFEKFEDYHAAADTICKLLKLDGPISFITLICQEGSLGITKTEKYVYEEDLDFDVNPLELK